MKPIEYSPRTPIDIFPCPAVVMQICNRQKFRNNIRLKKFARLRGMKYKVGDHNSWHWTVQAKPLAIVVSVSWLFVWRSPLEGQYSDVSPPEGRIAQSIAERIDGGVDIAETVGDVPHHLRDHVALVLAQDGLHDGQHVVRGPGQDEDQQDGGQRLGRLPLLPLLLRGLLQFVLAREGAGRDSGARVADALHIPGRGQCISPQRFTLFAPWLSSSFST